MKKVILSLVAVALFGAFALSSCKSASTEVSADSAVVEEVVPAVDTTAVDTAAVDTAVAQ